MIGYCMSGWIDEPEPNDQAVASSSGVLIQQYNSIKNQIIAMKTLRVLLVATAITATSLLGSIAANACGDGGSTYQGGGYTVTIGDEGNYYGCNSKNQCLEIAQYSSQTQGQYIWENKGMTYSMTPIAGKNGLYRLKVVNAKNRVVVSKIMKPVSP
jgi:hypothetical protein